MILSTHFRVNRALPLRSPYVRPPSLLWLFDARWRKRQAEQDGGHVLHHVLPCARRAPKALATHTSDLMLDCGAVFANKKKRKFYVEECPVDAQFLRKCVDSIMKLDQKSKVKSQKKEKERSKISRRMRQRTNQAKRPTAPGLRAWSPTALLSRPGRA